MATCSSPFFPHFSLENSHFPGKNRGLIYQPGGSRSIRDKNVSMTRHVFCHHFHDHVPKQQGGSGKRNLRANQALEGCNKRYEPKSIKKCIKEKNLEVSQIFNLKIKVKPVEFLQNSGLYIFLIDLALSLY